MAPKGLFCIVKTNEPIKATDKYRILTSLEAEEYELLLSHFDKKVRKKQKKYTMKGKQRKRSPNKEQKNSSLYGSRKKLDFVLMYLKENPNQAFYGYTYGLSQSKVSEWLSFLLPVLGESLKQMGFEAAYGCIYVHKSIEDEYLIGDIVERNIPKRSCHKAQKEEYSGKKKCHTIKHYGLCDESGYIHFLSPSYDGSVHDKTIWDDLSVKTAGQNLLMDLGFLGAENDRIDVILPFKKPKKGKLSIIQKQLNQALNSLRVTIEHAFGSIKRLKIIREKIRLKGYDKREIVMKIAVALHNFRTTSRKPIQIHS